MRHAGTYFPGRGTIVEESFLDGYAAGCREAFGAGYEIVLTVAVLRVLAERGLVASGETKALIASTMDAAAFTGWMVRARGATREADLLRGAPPFHGTGDEP
ncbi:hypothetical protein [Streptomyces sp. NPDC059816]|uniref:hypothetical protein n=1 Tax=Streptomyces sp. NPDC059816 TaxID=3346960 RepID=UPI003649FA8A